MEGIVTAQPSALLGSMSMDFVNLKKWDTSSSPLSLINSLLPNQEFARLFLVAIFLADRKLQKLYEI